jgi:hypothetical protein
MQFHHPKHCRLESGSFARLFKAHSSCSTELFQSNFPSLISDLSSLISQLDPSVPEFDCGDLTHLCEQMTSLTDEEWKSLATFFGSFTEFCSQSPGSPSTEYLMSFCVETVIVAIDLGAPSCFLWDEFSILHFIDWLMGSSDYAPLFTSLPLCQILRMIILLAGLPLDSDFQQAFFQNIFTTVLTITETSFDSISSAGLDEFQALALIAVSRLCVCHPDFPILEPIFESIIPPYLCLFPSAASGDLESDCFLIRYLFQISEHPRTDQAIRLGFMDTFTVEFLPEVLPGFLALPDAAICDLLIGIQAVRYQTQVVREVCTLITSSWRSISWALMPDMGNELLNRNRLWWMKLMTVFNSPEIDWNSELEAQWGAANHPIAVHKAMLVKSLQKDSAHAEFFLEFICEAIQTGDFDVKDICIGFLHLLVDSCWSVIERHFISFFKGICSIAVEIYIDGLSPFSEANTDLFLDAWANFLDRLKSMVFPHELFEDPDVCALCDTVPPCPDLLPGEVSDYDVDPGEQAWKVHLNIPL